MQDVELFIHMAEIAGVFVGFGALIAIRSGAAAEMRELSSLRWVMSTGIWVVIAALAPIMVSRYGVAGHELWLGCSLFALALYVVMLIVNGLAPENLADVGVTLASTPRRVIVLVMGSTFWLPTLVLVVALAVVGFGRFPDQEQALYLTSVGLGVFMGALGLLAAVFWREPPSAFARPAAPGGSGG